MKSNRFSHLIAAAFSLLALSSANCAENGKTDQASSPPANEATAIPVKTAPSGTNTPAAVAAVDHSEASWINIADCTYDTRARFFAGLKGLESKVDSQVRELNAKRAAMKSTTNTDDWDFAMKEMILAQSYLREMGEKLAKTSPDSWGQQKDTVGDAWARSQRAYDAVKSSTTT
jgi:outer membrane murein-binding lipoprotein Lpp